MPDIVWFSQVDKEDVPLVGGKGANLGELYKLGISIPNGFIITSQAYFENIKRSGTLDRIKGILYDVDVENPVLLDSKAKACQAEIKKISLDNNLEQKIYDYYERLSNGKSVYVAVRSSATAEDLPEASFAGQQSTFLNICGKKKLKEAILNAWASLFEARAIFYRVQKQFDHFKVGIALPIQKMVQSEVSGIMFTIDPVTNNKKRIIIESIFGLGELIVSGQITPDHYEVNKKNFKIVQKNIISQDKQLVRKDNINKIIAISKPYRMTQKLKDDKIIELTKLGLKIEKHYFFPQDIEWAMENDKLYIVQTRPVTTIKAIKDIKKVVAETKNTGYKPILQGAPASPKIGTGRVVILKSAKELNKVKEGEIVTVDGVKGLVYKGSQSQKRLVLDYEKHKDIKKYYKTATNLYVNLAEPELAKEISVKNVDGVGLLRAEFLLAQIGIHPKEFIREKKEEIYIKQLSEGLCIFCKAFGNRPVIYRSSDLKSNEYKNLKGGDTYAPVESNPMLGFRGADRYIKDPDVFKLELEAIKRTRKKYSNLHLMIPFVRTTEELKNVRDIVSEKGFFEDSSFKFLMMVEIPTNVIQLEEFIKIGIDGISIGSNDLTMLILGTDRDNEEVSQEFKELDKSVLWAVEKAVKVDNRAKITSSICGQAPSVYPELTQMLVSWGITSISVNPDVIETTRQYIYEAEEKHLKNKG